MAWRCSGVTNDDMVTKLKRFGVIRTQAVENAFRAVDRKFFCPPSETSLAYRDQPVGEGKLRISAPHIYGTVLEALDMDQPRRRQQDESSGSALTFLNIGSGTGYLSCLVAELVGPAGSCFGVELQQQAVDHSRKAIQAWKQDRFANSSAAAADGQMAHMEVIQGNGLCIDATVGEAVVGFDRIYIGASVQRKDLPKLADLLRPGGVLVGPVGDELVKVVRVTKHESSSHQSSDDQSSSTMALPRTLRGQFPLLSADFTTTTLSGVRFTRLAHNPAVPVVIRSRVWEPALHKFYPQSFRKSSKEIMLCSSASPIQTVPTTSPSARRVRLNLAASIPKALWMEVLSYTHRDWFEQPQSEESRLQSRVRQLEFSLQRAVEARQDVEKRLRIAEGERDIYRDMARTWQTRIEHVLTNETLDLALLRQQAAAEGAADEDTTDGGSDDEDDDDEGFGDGADGADDMEEETEADEEEQEEDIAEPMSISPVVVRSQIRTVSISSSSDV